MQQQRRTSPRLKDFDYAQPGPYFITTVTLGRENLFGQIVDGKMLINPFGQIVTESWQWLEIHYPYLSLGQSIVMPDHFHGIISIGDLPSRSDRSRPLQGVSPEKMRGQMSRLATTTKPMKIKPLDQLIGAFKTVSSKRINLLRGTPGLPVWQRGFFDRIIRDEAKMSRIHMYILDNPVNWQEGREYSELEEHTYRY